MRNNFADLEGNFSFMTWQGNCQTLTNTPWWGTYFFSNKTLSKLRCSITVPLCAEKILGTEVIASFCRSNWICTFLSDWAGRSVYKGTHCKNCQLSFVKISLVSEIYDASQLINIFKNVFAKRTPWLPLGLKNTFAD